MKGRVAGGSLRVSSSDRDSESFHKISFESIKLISGKTDTCFTLLKLEFLARQNLQESKIDKAREEKIWGLPNPRRKRALSDTWF